MEVLFSKEVLRFPKCVTDKMEKTKLQSMQFFYMQRCTKGMVDFIWKVCTDFHTTVPWNKFENEYTEKFTLSKWESSLL